jgi:hypothetical protein
MMKAITKYLSLTLMLVFSLYACNKEEFWYQTYKAGGSAQLQLLVSQFEGSVDVDLQGDVYQSSNTFNLGVQLLGAPQSADVKAKIKVVSSAGSTEGVEWSIPNKEVTIKAGEASASFALVINNKVAVLDQWYEIKIALDESSGLPIYTNIGNEATINFQVKLSDAFHPLSAWIGSYTVNAASYGKPGDWDESWNVTTTSDPEDKTHLIISGIGTNKSTPFIATVNKAAGLIVIKSGTSIGDPYGLGGNIGIFKGTADGTDLTSDDVVGTILEDGSIEIDLWGQLVLDGQYANQLYDVFNTHWTLNKSATIGKNTIPVSKTARFN